MNLEREVGWDNKDLGDIMGIFLSFLLVLLINKCKRKQSTLDIITSKKKINFLQTWRGKEGGIRKIWVVLWGFFFVFIDFIY